MLIALGFNMRAHVYRSCFPLLRLLRNKRGKRLESTLKREDCCLNSFGLIAMSRSSRWSMTYVIFKRSRTHFARACRHHIFCVQILDGDPIITPMPPSALSRNSQIKLVLSFLMKANISSPTLLSKADGPK